MPGLAFHKIITKGLHGGPACEGLITAHFSLYCVSVAPPPPAPSVGGGPYPGAAWNKVSDIQNFFKRVEQPYYLPHQHDKDLIHKKRIILKIDMGDIHVERNYIVSANRADILVKVLKVVNSSVHGIAARAKNVKNLAARAPFTIRNLKNKALGIVVAIRNFKLNNR